jgi:hypothetical protein
MVTDGPRDLIPWDASKAEPFVSSLNDAQGCHIGGTHDHHRKWGVPILLRRL